MKKLLIKSLVFTLLVPGTVAVITPQLIIQSATINLDWSFFSGLLLLSLGLLIYCWCVWDFAIFGRGTPAPVDAPKHLVIRGLYRYTRNPMYLGVLIFILGWSLFYSALVLLVYGFCVAICFQLFVVFYEEPRLKQLFGLDYIKYQSSVNRWLPEFMPSRIIR